MLVVGTSRVIERVRRYCVGIGRPMGNVDVPGFRALFCDKGYDTPGKLFDGTKSVDGAAGAL